MQSNTKDEFQAIPSQVDHTLTSAHMVAIHIDEVVVDAATTIGNPTSERPFFRYKCHPDEVPDVARDVTWYDSFYENDTDVIAAFDMKYEMADRILQKLILYYLISFLLLPFGIGIIFLILLCNNENLNWRSYRLRRTHVAIARQGIYFDQVDEPGSRALMSRTVIPYDQIDEIVVKVVKDYCQLNYEVFVYRKNNQPALQVTCLVETQTFVDVVHALMERSRRRNESTNTEVPGSMERFEIEPTNEEEIVVAVANLI
jgi:hypothetical protein